MTSYTVSELLSNNQILPEVEIKGWVRTFRANRFIALNDGSTINNIQCVVDFENTDEALLKRITTGAAVHIKGELVESQGKGQKVEIIVSSIQILGDSNPETFPIQPKKHSLEFLRENAHLRTRTNTFSAVMRLRSALSFAIHSYFNKNGFYYMHAPIITGSDAEGAGEMFRVSTLPAINPPIKIIDEKKSKIDYSKFDHLANEYYKVILEYVIKSNDLGLEEVKSLISSTLTHEKFDLKKLILLKPEQLEKLKNRIDKDIAFKNRLKKLFKSFSSLHTRFREGRINTMDKKDLVLKIKAICRENGWRLDNIAGKTIRRIYSPNEYPSLSLCFYNLFSITNLNEVDYSQDFFGKETNLTVSGQLEAETYAMSLGKVYTFGPTFRAENSNTSRHLAEFWMIEPEVAFMDLAGNMDLAEDFLKYVLGYVLTNNREDLEFLEKRLLDEEKSKPQAERSELSLIEKLNFVIDNNFKRVSYTEAIDILRNSTPNKKKKFKYIINEWGADLQSEHERFLVEKHFKCPVILFDYPANIKAFYMRLNEDGKTVRAMDILFPGIGEIVGGSQREERLDVLKEKMAALGIDENELWWYLDLRKYGTAVHSGFGLGFERLVMFATGMGNIRDVIPYPRTPQNAEF
ncbi:hypothetical protein GCM10007962_04290 [Yeosuana aromativorans]|uniref:Asparagine--tRNA ligase n=1 Tax=Yeosuana aromativorans TaxID=288019 RepID=A0A8J3BJD3_9FLAO|nr:hypothetical protein GCM10007962_04290 [Yeosuana aromativorans]